MTVSSFRLRRLLRTISPQLLQDPLLGARDLHLRHPKLLGYLHLRPILEVPQTDDLLLIRNSSGRQSATIYATSNAIR